MNIVETIQNHKTFDTQEERYKESFLQFFKYFPKEMWGVRENLIGHLTASAWVINKEKTKVLFAFHNIYNSWAWLEGHSDDDLDLLHVAKKEVMEESGLKETDFKPLFKIPFDIDTAAVHSHMKKELFIPDHLHYNVTYLFEADENAPLQHLPEENSDVKWIHIDELLSKVSEEHMKPIYKRIMEKVRSL